MAKQRELVVAAAKGYKTRTETFEDREYLVVPVVALVEGVVHAMNAETPEFVSAEEFSRAPAGWNNRPLYHGHPIVDGHPVSGNSPEVLEALSIGRVFNTAVKSKKLSMEAWIDVLKAEEKAPELLQRVKDGESIEISVGVFVETDDEKGEFGGKKYLGAWHDIVPDHLALLPKGDEGACSVDMGCGVRAAQKKETNVADEKTNKKPTLLGKFLQMFRAAQPASEMSDSDLRLKLYKALQEKGVGNVNYVEAFIPVVNPNRVVYSVYVPGVPESGMGYSSFYELHERAFTLGDNGVITLADAYVEVEPVLSYEPVLMAEEVGEKEPTAAKGARNSKADQKKIQAMHDHALDLGAYCDPKMASAEPKAASGAQCSCGGHITPAKENDMTPEALKKFIDTATPEQMKALSTAAGEKPEAAAPVAAAPAAAAVVETPVVPAVAEVKEPTFADLMAKASPAVKAQYESTLQAAASKKTATIKALKDTGRCSLTDAQLEAKEQAELDSLVALSGAPKIDFGGQGGPKDLATGSNEAAPAPPDMAARILASRKK